MLSTPRAAATLGAAIAWTVLALAGGGAGAAPAPERPRAILLITVDTLRADRLSGYGYGRRTSPHVDRLMAEGVRFTRARTMIPLTCPALSSMVTGLAPHEHGASRNGLRIRPGLHSFPGVLRRRGYVTAAFVSNWTLQDKLCGLGEHFSHWREVLTRRPFLIGKREARAHDVTRAALAWMQRHLEVRPERAFLLWTHYVDPHFPYDLQRPFLDQLGLGRHRGAFGAGARYDSEVASVDHSVGELLQEIARRLDPRSTLVVFSADHGESLGEHGYWGHGRHLYDNGLRIPLSITWPERIAAREIDAPALLYDVGATLLGLTGLPPPPGFRGFDWTPVLLGDAAAPAGRITRHQAHRGTVGDSEDPERARQRGLLEVGRVQAERKEILRVRKGRRLLFDLDADPAEDASRVDPGTPPTAELVAWLGEVLGGLSSPEHPLPAPLDESVRRRLEALGYVD